MEKGQLTRTQQYAERIKKIQEKFKIEDKMSANLQNMAKQSALRPNIPYQSGPSNTSQAGSSELSLSTLANSTLSAAEQLSALSNNPEYNMLNKKEKKKLRKKLKKKEEKEKKRGENSNAISSQASHSEIGAPLSKEEEQEEVIEENKEEDDLATMVEKEAQLNAAEKNQGRKHYKPVRSVTEDTKKKPANFFEKFSYAFSCLEFPTPDLEALTEQKNQKGEM